MRFLFEDAKLDSMRRDFEAHGLFNEFGADVFDNIIAMDPMSKGGGAGQIAKSLLLPKFIAGEHDFIDNAADIRAAAENYYANRGSYPNEAKNVGNFSSVKQFVDFVNDPSSVSIGVAAQENPVDAMYNKYYTQIPRGYFELLIAMDPNTVFEHKPSDRVGQVARTFYLPHALAAINGEEPPFDSDDTLSALEKAMEYFNANASAMPVEKQNLSYYKTVADFISEMTPASAEYCKYTQDILDFISHPEDIDMPDCDAWNNNRGHIRDCVKLLGETSQFVVWEIHNRFGNMLVANGGWDNALSRTHNWWRECPLYHEGTKGQRWCTSSSNEVPSYYRNYGPSAENIDNMAEGGVYIDFINKNYAYPTCESDKKYSFQVGLNRDNPNSPWRLNSQSTFLDGNDGSELYGGGDSGFKKFFIMNPEVAELLHNNPDYTNTACLNAVIDSLKGEIEINSWSDWNKMYNLRAEDLQTSIKKVTLGSGITRIPAAIFSGTAITEITIPSSVKVIEAGAFYNCNLLAQLIFEEGVESIERDAFSGCVGLNKKSVILPNSLKTIGPKAFNNTNCQLKVKTSRVESGIRLKVDPNDHDFYATHLTTVNA